MGCLSILHNKKQKEIGAKAMRKTAAFFSVLITICIILMLMFTPDYILANSKRNMLHEWHNKGVESYAGIINVWHIIGFKPHSGSTSIWLNTRAVEYEKKHKNIFINIVPMSVEEYYTMLATGEKPDLVSFPLGLEYADSFLPYDLSFQESIESNMNSYLKAVGMVNDTAYALPYFYSGYALMLNTERINRTQLIFEEEITNELLQQANDMLFEEATGKKKTIYGISGNPKVAALLGMHCTLGSYESFQNNNAGMALTDFRAVGDMERLNKNGKGVIFEAKPITAYTDLVQLISVHSDIAPEKLSHAYEFIEYLFDEKAQAELFNMNLYPVVQIENNDESYLTAIALDCYEIYKAPIVPNTFLYRRYNDSLNEEALRALSGNEEADKAFFNRINEMLIPSLRFDIAS